MDSKRLKEWMKKTGWNPVHVAAELNISQRTVERFLGGRTVQPVIRDAFLRLLETPVKSVKRA